MKNFMTFSLARRLRLVGDRIGQLADARNPDGDRVARLQRADARRRAGRDDVARQQRHDAGDVGDQLVDREHSCLVDEFWRALAVDPAFDADAGQRVVVDARPRRTGRSARRCRTPWRACTAPPSAAARAR